MPAKEEVQRKKLVVEEVAQTPAEVSESVPEATTDTTEKEIEEPVKQPETSEVETQQPEPKETASPLPEPKGPSPLIIIIPGTFLLGALLGGIVYYQGKVSNGVIVASPTPIQEQVSQSPSPTSSSKESLDLGKYSINVQNGSGIKGEASKVQELLENADFKVSATGNADSYDYEETIIKAKASIEEDYIKALTETLSETYEVGKSVTLSASSKDDVILIIGSSKN